MLSVSSEDDFRELLRRDKAMIFLDFEWSGQAKLSGQIIEEWERTSRIHNPGVEVEVWRVLLDDQPWAAEWLPKDHEDLATGGHGAVLWLHRGQIVAHEPAAYAAGVRGLSTRTTEAFGDGTA